MADLRYPLSDMGNSTVQFSAFNSSDPTEYIGSVELYCPPNVAIGDGMNYGDVNLDVLGSEAAKNVIQGWKSGGVTDFTGALGSELLNTLKSGSNEFLKTFSASLVGLDQDVVNFLSRKVKSPNTHTTFQGVNMRNFSFDFRMVAEEKSESDQIKQIIDFLRVNTYPELSSNTGFISFLKFPPLWTIQFLYNGNENSYMPVIDYCFLQNVSTVYNTQESSFFEETGAPFDVSVSLSFVESKAQDKKSINERSLPTI